MSRPGKGKIECSHVVKGLGFIGEILHQHLDTMLRRGDTEYVVVAPVKQAQSRAVFMRIARVIKLQNVAHALEPVCVTGGGLRSWRLLRRNRC